MNEGNGGRHCYPGTNILVNKYDIRDGDKLEKLEIQKTAIKLLSLDIHPQKIGRRRWCGKLRQIPRASSRPGQKESAFLRRGGR